MQETACAWWSSVQFCPMRNSGQMANVKMDPTILYQKHVGGMCLFLFFRSNKGDFHLYDSIFQSLKSQMHLDQIIGLKWVQFPNKSIKWMKIWMFILTCSIAFKIAFQTLVRFIITNYGLVWPVFWATAW